LTNATLQASRTLGARWWDTLLTIILPGNIPGVTQTIPLAIYEYTKRG